MFDGQIYEYFLMHANGTGAAKGGSAVCVFACISLFARALWIAWYFFLFCTGLAAAKSAQSFSESAPESAEIVN